MSLKFDPRCVNLHLICCTLSLQVGVLDGKGFSVNIPWSCGGVGDNDYIFAFQHVVLPIGMIEE